MYRHCIYCKSDLASNEVIERFPVGRRLAFDAARGRLWVVCKQCHRWNLTPLDERWEAIESCERLYRDTRTRLATENIGLARLGDGTDLVRIGQPQRPEFAAWRYGDQLLHRRRRAIRHALVAMGVGMGAVAVGGTTIGISSFVGTQLLFVFPPQLLAAYHARRRIASITDQQGITRHYRRNDVTQTQLLTASDGWRLRIPHKDGAIAFTGASANRAAAIILPHLNAGGARAATIQFAVKDIQGNATTDSYFERVAKHLAATDLHFMGGRYHGFLMRAPAPMRIALEMISHEDQERRALEGELHELEALWREAEEIASIADNLLLPQAVSDWLKNRKSEQQR